MDIRKLEDKFKQLFSITPFIVRSPGRINLIGEHTDYNDGFVFPAAINKAAYFAVARNHLDKFRFFAFDLNEYFELDVSGLQPVKTPHWTNYLLGVAAQFNKEKNLPAGIDCVFSSDIPVGAGLSSSAAIENGFAFALNHLFNREKSRIELAKMAQKAEHEYAGVQCGIMDQFAGMYGKKDHAVKLDCRTLDYEYANVNLDDYSLILCDTKVKHKLASSEYNIRRKECETGVHVLQRVNPDIHALRDVNVDFLEQHKKTLDSVVYKRCAYVIKENIRVKEAFNALQNNDLMEFGQLMYQSHEGLRDEYEVSCKELDLLFDLAVKSDEVIGARMMGGGFGGCTINLVKTSQIESFSAKITRAYHDATGVTPGIITVTVDDGTAMYKG
jgi:galactokinase